MKRRSAEGQEEKGLARDNAGARPALRARRERDLVVENLPTTAVLERVSTR
jgi:hypothetical protein